MSDTVEREDAFGNKVDVPTGQDGVNPVSPQNPPGAAYDPEEKGAVTAETHTLGVDYGNLDAPVTASADEIEAAEAEASAEAPDDEETADPEPEPEPVPEVSEAAAEAVAPAEAETDEADADPESEDAEA